MLLTFSVFEMQQKQIQHDILIVQCDTVFDERTKKLLLYSFNNQKQISSQMQIQIIYNYYSVKDVIYSFNLLFLVIAEKENRNEKKSEYHGIRK
jgi:hypothetical protein